MNEYIWGRNSINEAIKNNRIIEAYVLSDSPYIEILKKKNIPFKKGKAYFKGQELSSIDSYIHSLIDEIDDIDCSLMVLKDPSI